MSGLAGWYGGGAPRGHIPPMKYIKQFVLSSSAGDILGPSIPLGPDACVGYSFQNSWNDSAGTLVAVITIEASNDPRAFPGHEEYLDAVWSDLTALIVPVNPTSGAGSDLVMVSDARFEYVRMNLTYASGSGLFKSDFSAHGN